MRHAAKKSTQPLIAKLLVAILATGAIAGTAAAPASATVATSAGSQSASLQVVQSSTTVLNNVLTTADDLVITGFPVGAAERVRVVLTETGGGQIRLGSISGLSAVTGYTPLNTTASNSIGFTSTQDGANAALATIEYIAGSGFEKANLRVEVTYVGNRDVAFFNGSYYEFFAPSPLLTWTAARAAAKTNPFNGLTGYLANSTSLGENNFIKSKTGSAAAWLGGSDSGVEGEWRWMDGPEAGLQFWRGATGGSKFTADGIDFENWSKNSSSPPVYSEPNEFSPGEDALQILSGGTGAWNDLPSSSSLLPYIVEYGGYSNDAPTYPPAIRNITVDVNFPAVSAANGKCTQNVSNTTGVTVSANDDGTLCIVRFANTGSVNWRSPAGLTTVDALIVAGGGGGGAHVGGGGGAGGVIQKTGSSAQSITPNTSYPIAVGAGGTGAFKPASGALTPATAGDNSAFAGNTSVGGGVGASYLAQNAGTGGSGGGGSSSNVGSGGSRNHGAGTTSQGNRGGSFSSSTSDIVAANSGYPTGGGGGAGGAGVDPANGTAPNGISGAGGPGLSSNIASLTNEPTVYAGGGGGGLHATGTLDSNGTVGAGGTGGGGSGAGPNRTNYGIVMTSVVVGQSGVVNSGGGGGGSGAHSPLAGSTSRGGNGGSGVVVIRYAAAAAPLVSQPSNAVATPGTTASFSVNATVPAGALTYQWQLLLPGGDWANVSSGTGGTTPSYATPSLSLGDNGNSYRVIVTNTLGGASSTTTSAAATLRMGTAQPVNVNFTELNFNFTAGNFVYLKRTNTSGTSALNTISSSDTTSGRTLGDRVLYKNVTTRTINGVSVSIDAVVTTKQIVNATINRYETGAQAGGTGPNFQVDIDVSQQRGFAEFEFDFYIQSANMVASCNASVTCGSETKVVLQNVNVTGIDIDSNQFNDFTNLDSYTLSSDTRLHECAIASGAPNPTCTSSSAAITSFPANVRYQGGSSSGSNLVQDQVVANYGSIEKFSVKFGRLTSGSPNFFGVAFKALSWGSSTPQTFGPPANISPPFEITYNGNSATSGVVPLTQSNVVGTNVVVSGNTGTLSRSGFTFGGWNTLANGQGDAYAPGESIQMPLNGAILFAVWSASQVTLTYDANGGSSAPAVQLRTAGSNFTLPASSANPTRSGFSFLGWAAISSSSVQEFSAGASYTMPGSATTLYAVWQAANGSISYNSNGGTGTLPADNSGTAGTSVIAKAQNATSSVAAPATLARNGFTFAGWNTVAGGTGIDYAPGSSIVLPGSGTTELFAQWTPVLYSLSYNSNGGTAAPATVNAIAGATLTLGAAPTMAGATFLNWVTGTNGIGGTSYAAGLTPYSMPSANTVLYASWAQVTYTISFDKNDAGAGAAPSNTTRTFGQLFALSGATAPTAPTGKVFAGWNTQANGSGPTYSLTQNFQMPAANTTLYAVWLAANATLAYNGNGGTGTAADSVHALNTVFTLTPTVPTRAGFEFAGWNTEPGGGGINYASGASFSMSANTTLYAKWTQLSYTLRYNGNASGVSGIPAIVVKFMGDVVTVVQGSIARLGFTFSGWNTRADGLGTDYNTGNTFLMPNAEVNLYAKWLSSPFTLTYNSNGGSALGTPTETRNALVTANLTASVPSYPGHSFTGWNTALDGSGTGYAASGSFTMSPNNVILYAQWSVNSNALNFSANGGSGAPAGLNGNFRSTLTVPITEPTRPGFVFTGWNTVAGGSGTSYLPGDTLVMGSAAITLHAQWSAVQYRVTYSANGGQRVPVASSQDFGSTVSVTASIPTRVGYSFLGWNTASNGAGNTLAGSSSFTMPANDVTIFAIWSINTYTLYYNANGGTGTIAAQPGQFGNILPVSTFVPTRPGFTFVGWNTGADSLGDDAGAGFTLPGSDVTLYAKWAAINYSISYNGNGGTASQSPQTGTLGNTITLSSADATRPGFHQNGWNTLANGLGTSYAKAGSFPVPASNTVLYAVWVADTFDVIYNPNGGTGAALSQNWATSSTVTLANSDFVRPGYTFTHWNTLPNGSGTNYQRTNGTFTMPAQFEVLYANWVANQITITFDLNGGTGAAPSEPAQAFGTALPLPNDTGFSNAGKVLVGWNTQANGLGVTHAPEANFTLPTESATVYAKWESVFFAVGFEANGGSGAPADQFLAAGQQVNLTTSQPTRSGYDFSSWKDVGQANTFSSGASFVMPSNNLIMVANWTVRTLNVGGGSGGGVSTTPPSTPAATPTPTLTPEVSPSPFPEPTVKAKKVTQTVFFGGDSAVLTKATKARLKKLATRIEGFGRASSIVVIGRVNGTRITAFDARLSRQRAANVTRFLRTLGVSGTYRLQAAGIAPEKGAKARRADITIVWNAK